MKALRVLLLDSCGLTAYRCTGRASEAEAVFPEASAAFAAYLDLHAGDVFALLVNLPEESFEPEAIPHVWLGREAMLARKRSRHAHGSPYCIALPQGRQPDGRRDDRFLFAALAGARTIAPWLQRLEHCQSALRGIYSLPQLAPRLGLGGGAAQVLASPTRGGLRQTVLIDGRLRFSRLTALPADADVAAACLMEATNLRRYLCGQRLIEREAPLPVRILADSARIEQFRGHCRDTEELRFELVELAAEASRRRLAHSFERCQADALFAHLLAYSPPKEQFGPAGSRQYWRALLCRRALDGVAMAAAAAASVAVAVVLPHSLQLREAAAQLRAANDAAARGTDGATGMSGGPADISSGELGDLAGAHAALVRLAPGPRPLLARLGRALDEVGAVELESLDWRIAGEFENDKGGYAVLEVKGSATDADPRTQGERLKQLEDRLGADGLRVAMVAAAPGRAAGADEPAARSFVMRLGQRL
ncbi:MAG TPA: hypothetical protein VF801_14085 [Rhodocyclaceae bacterium]